MCNCESSHYYHSLPDVAVLFFLLCNNSYPEVLSCREGMTPSYFKTGMLKKDLDLVYPLEREEKDDTDSQTWWPDVFAVYFCHSFPLEIMLRLSAKQLQRKHPLNQVLHMYIRTAPVLISPLFVREFSKLSVPLWLCCYCCAANIYWGVLYLPSTNLLVMPVVDDSWHCVLFHFALSGYPGHCCHTV